MKRQELVRRIQHLITTFPDTPTAKLVARGEALDRRRAKNRRARASRKRNRKK